MAFILGLTGGIGAGKSLASDFFKAQNLPVVDADAISRSLTAAGGVAVPEIRAAFGEDSVTADGAMDRAYVRERVFADDFALYALEAILAPHLRTSIEAALKKAADTSPLVIFDCPLLFDRPHWQTLCNKTLYIDADEAIRLERVLQRPGLTRETAQRIMEKQTDPTVAKAKADLVIENNGTVEAFERALQSVLDGLRAL